MTTEKISEEELAELVQRTKQATTFFMRGEMDRYLELTEHASGFTLMNPLGGPPERHEDRAESLRAAADFFKGGEATEMEVAETHAWGDTVVLVMIERQHGEVGGLPDQDWPLRVTQVYRREGSDWLLVHRHADPLLHGISLDQAATLARG
jgi:ketosteroid isomerase-like protein